MQYKDFLRAVAKFPKFCGEYANGNDWPSKYGSPWEQACRKELATLFAHFDQETSGLKVLTEGDETSGDYISETAANKKAYPAAAGKQYYGRGPTQLSWNYNYGMFGNIFDSQSMTGKMKFINNPDGLIADGYTAFTSAIWFYMTPQDAQPSMHDIVTGFWKPNTVDTKAHIDASFAATSVIINGDKECGRGIGKLQKAVNRGNHYKKHMKALSMPTDDLQPEDIDCGNMPREWPSGSTNDNLYQYFAKDWSTKNKCKPVQYYTEYSIFGPDDYKRCVCAEWK